jgi:3-oxoacyl-[acyl-carrier-protein] synthase III
MSDKLIGIAGISAALPERFAPLAQLTLLSPAENLAAFGFTGAAIADDAAVLAARSAQQALAHAGVAPDEIDLLLWASARASAHHRPSGVSNGGVLDEFCYAASWLQEELGLDRAAVSGIAQQGCAGMFAALRLARAVLVAEPHRQHVLCVGVDALPAEACREVLYNVISDAACAVVVSRRRGRFGWLGFHQVSKGYYWDVPVRSREIIAAYFPTAKAVILEALAQSGLQPGDIDLVIPTGVNASSWPILLRLCGLPESRLFQPRERIGHTIAADSFLLLQEAVATGAVRPGMKLLLFTYGFGSSWCALVLEATGEVAR